MEKSIICSTPECNARNAWASDRCTVCKTDLGSPIRREVLGSEERGALQKRYQAAWEEAGSRGFADRLRLFEDEVRSRSVATVSMSPLFLDRMLDDGALYASYDLLVSSEVREPAARGDDRARSGVEGILFGSIASDIRYAALSLDGTGLKSYGSCSVVLREVAVKGSATLLEDNSYKFVQDHQLTPLGDIPAGYRSAWPERHMLATAKLATKIGTAAAEMSAPEILLFSRGNRKTDDFIEIHVWGAFGHQSIERVLVPNPENAPGHEQGILLRIRDRMAHRERQCEFV